MCVVVRWERENGKRMDGWIDVVGEGMVWDGWWVGCVGWGGGQGEGESQRTGVLAYVEDLLRTAALLL